VSVLEYRTRLTNIKYWQLKKNMISDVTQTIKDNHLLFVLVEILRYNNIK
jgi:hypothetical protein